MALTTGVSVQEYLTSMYEPDCDYVDGEVVERNVGEYDHSSIQVLLIALLLDAARQQSIRVKSELRMRVSSTRYRIPDVLVMLKSQRVEPVLTEPPFLCIEIVSPEDRMSRITERVRDYLTFGVQYVWVIDPQTRTAWQHTAQGSAEVRDTLMTEKPDLAISLADLFARLDEERQ